MCRVRVRGLRKISLGGSAGGSESESDSGSASGPGPGGAGAVAGAGGTGVSAGKLSLTVLRRAGELSVRVRRAAAGWCCCCWTKDKGGNTDSRGQTGRVGDRVKTGLRGEGMRGAVAGGVGGSG